MSRQNLWAKASEQETIAEKTCLSISQFRLTAKHLELFSLQTAAPWSFIPQRGAKPRSKLEMALPWDKRDFASWREALVQHRLTDKQIDLLEGMVQEGQAESVQAAAEMLDWQENVVDPDEHMYGS